MRCTLLTLGLVTTMMFASSYALDDSTIQDAIKNGGLSFEQVVDPFLQVSDGSEDYRIFRRDMSDKAAHIQRRSFLLRRKQGHAAYHRRFETDEEEEDENEADEDEHERDENENEADENEADEDGVLARSDVENLEEQEQQVEEEITDEDQEGEEED